MGRNNIFEPEKEIENICNWIKDYFVNNGPDAKAVVGISGGKDSTIAAALLVRALGRERVVGVMMPEHMQSDINDSHRVCESLGIRGVEINIGPACDTLYNCIDIGINVKDVRTVPAITSNTPARIRMTTLYAVAAMVHGRVANTCNWSEDFVGYSTKYGDDAGDFALLKNYAVREVITMGAVLAKEMNIPIELITKTPSDGMCGKTDEDNLGFTYDTLDSMLIDGIVPEYDVYENIMTRYKRNRHKTRALTLPCPRPLVYRSQYWDCEMEFAAF